jgi:NDP-sugar pyrophosphorylase family protein
MLPVIILAGGLATRLHPITVEIPKSLILIDGMPFIHHQILLLKERGVDSTILCVGHFGHMIEEFIGDGLQYNVHIQYSYDGDVLLGTGGAVKKASRLVEDTFMIQYGDSYLDISYEDVVGAYYQAESPVLMTAYHNKNKFDESNMLVKDGKIVQYNKFSKTDDFEHIDYGLIVMRKDVMNINSDASFDLGDLLSTCVNNGMVSAYEVNTRFYEIGSLSGILETTEYIASKKGNTELL